MKGKTTKRVRSASANLTAARRKTLLMRMATVPFPRMLGIRAERLAPGDVTLSMRIRKELTQYQGIAHGGALASLADTAATFAALTVIPDDTDVVTVEFKVNFLAGITQGKVTARARTIRVGSRVAVMEAELHGPTKDRLVLTGTFTMLVFAKHQA